MSEWLDILRRTLPRPQDTGGRLIASTGLSQGAGPTAHRDKEGLGSHLALQGLRAVAALLVVIDHAVIAGADAGLLAAHYRPLAAFTGLLGVHVFFVISGVVMILGHGDDFGRPGAGRIFMARRIGRIVPPYWLATFIVLVIRPDMAGSGDLIRSLLFIPNLTDGGPYGWPVFPLGWTLQYEMVFYLLFALALGFRRGIGLALIAGAIAALAAAAAAGLSGAGSLPAYYGHPIILYFLAGIGVGLAAPVLRARIRIGFHAALFLACALLALACATAHLAGADARPSIAAAAAAALAATAACTLHGPDQAAGRARRLARALGDASYSIYLSHAFLVFPMGGLVARSGAKPPFLLFLTAALAVSALAGLVIYRGLERPLVRAFGRLLGQRPGIGGRPA